MRDSTIPMLRTVDNDLETTEDSYYSLANLFLRMKMDKKITKFLTSESTVTSEEKDMT